MQLIEGAPTRSTRPKPSVIGAKDRIGRIQVAIRRSFIAANGRPLTIRDFLRSAFPRTTQHSHWQRKSCHRAIPRFGICLGRMPGWGRPNLWVPNAELRRLIGR
jgi:hypothetical protein